MLLLEQYMKPQQIASIVACSRIKVYQIKRDLKVFGQGSKYLTNELRCKVSSMIGQAERVEKIMQQNPFKKLTLTQINDKLTKSRPRLHKLSKSTVRHILKDRLSYRWKRCSIRSNKILGQEYIEDKLLWCRFYLLAFHSEKRVIAIDEFAIDDQNVQNYAWCKKYQDAYTLTYPRKPRLNCIIAHDSSELLFTLVQKATIKGDDFLEFIGDLL